MVIQLCQEEAEWLTTNASRNRPVINLRHRPSLYPGIKTWFFRLLAV
jgi:hypothetical protein